MTPSPEHAEPRLPEAKMHIYRPNAPVVAKVVRNELCTGKKASAFIRHVDFDVTGTDLVGQCLPGQSIGVIPPGVDSLGRPHKVRLYSIASPTRGEDRLDGAHGAGSSGAIISTTVKRTIDEHWENHKLFLGVASNYLCDLMPGDPVHLSGPNGKRFLIPVNAAEHDYVFFATGTGIAPFRGMVMDLLGARVNSRVVLIMGSPYATDLPYHDFFLRMQSQHANFTYLTAISRERQADGHDKLYVQDRLRTDRDRIVPVLDSPRTLVYICGIAGMELGIFQELASQLRPDTLDQYLHVDPEAMSDTKSWQRSMIHKQVRPTRRVVMEVYA